VRVSDPSDPTNLCKLSSGAITPANTSLNGLPRTMRTGKRFSASSPDVPQLIRTFTNLAHRSTTVSPASFSIPLIEQGKLIFPQI
jgi:hypothetical protein